MKSTLRSFFSKLDEIYPLFAFVLAMLEIVFGNTTEAILYTIIGLGLLTSRAINDIKEEIRDLRSELERRWI